MSKLNINRSYAVLLALVFVFCTFTAIAQNNATNLLNANDLSGLNVDQLSNDDITNINNQIQSIGLTADQTEKLFSGKGMAQDQWIKLRARLPAFNQNILPLSQQKLDSVSKTSSQSKNNNTLNQKSANSLKLFGSALFNKASLSFEPNLRIATPTNYVLGPDDELVINVSGSQETDTRIRVQPNGTILIPHVGTINVNGLTIDQATARIRDRMAQTAYPSIRSNLSTVVLSLGDIRSIHITVIGGAKPGNYTLSSLSTVFNSLFLCGGPDEINTFRNIELIRNNKVYQRIDLYNFLTKGDQTGNVPLKDNDVINFPVYKKHVTLRGQVKREGIYELKDKETLSDLLFFAGGYTNKAYRASVKIKQVTNIERQIKDVSRADFATYQPQDGDELQVDSVLDRFENGVAISGAVYRPGQFELTPGMTVSVLIKKAGGLQENVFTERATLTRTNPNGTKQNISFNINSVLNNPSSDISLIKRDSVIIATASEFISTYTVRIEGEVRRPGDYRYKEDFSLKDLIFQAGGATDAASSFHLEVGRRIITDRANESIDSIAIVQTINTDKGLSLENDKFILKPYDIVTVRRNPGYIKQQRVKIAGEVNFPGTYTISSKKEHVSNLLKRAGGLTPQAYAEGIFLIRKDADSTATNRQSVAVIQSSLRDTSTKVLTDVGRNNIRIAINLKKVLQEPGSIEDYVLRNGDSLQVLTQDPLVKVSGEVLTSTKTSFIEGKSLTYYLSQAGGPTERARRSKIYVLYANGKISRVKNGVFGMFRSYPTIRTGAEIIVPRKQEHRGLTTAETVGLASGLASIVSLIIVTISTLRK